MKSGARLQGKMCVCMLKFQLPSIVLGKCTASKSATFQMRNISHGYLWCILSHGTSGPTNTHKLCLDLSHVIGSLSVHINDCGFSPCSFLLVFWIRISHIPDHARLTFYKTIINIFTNDLELKDTSEFSYWGHGTNLSKAHRYLSVLSPF